MPWPTTITLTLESFFFWVVSLTSSSIFAVAELRNHARWRRRCLRDMSSGTRACVVSVSVCRLRGLCRTNLKDKIIKMRFKCACVRPRESGCGSTARDGTQTEQTGLSHERHAMLLSSVGRTALTSAAFFFLQSGRRPRNRNRRCGTAAVNVSVVRSPLPKKASHSPTTTIIVRITAVVNPAPNPAEQKRLPPFRA